MCGLLGELRTGDTNAPLSSAEAFSTALDLQWHRGPDGGATRFWPGISLGHRRLKIIDLSDDANQPMTDESGRYTLVFNGEIYNFKSLRDRLKGRGHSFHTDSDTEVLLRAFIEYGVECLSQLNGMFAFAIYDAETHCTHLVRDRLGIKPLYYSSTNGRFLFASEIKSIRALQGGPANFAETAIPAYLTYRQPLVNETFFADIHALPPGHYMRITSNSMQLVEYWDIAEHLNCSAADDLRESAYVAQLGKLLEEAVERRLVADVPVGAFLSGGVDSSLLTALMSKSAPHSARTFTIGFDEPGYNELDYARKAASMTSSDHTEMVLSASGYQALLPSLNAMKDAPLAVPNEVALYLLCQRLREDITVVLSGEGADEIFCGYGRIFASPVDYRRLQITARSDSLREKYGDRVFASEVEHFLYNYAYTDRSLLNELLSDRMDIAAGLGRVTSHVHQLFAKIPSGNYQDRIQYAFIKLHLVALLMRLDMTSMANSVEGRVPFLDHELVEFACALPGRYKLRWNSDRDRKASRDLSSDDFSERYDTPKYLLKKVAEPCLGRDIIYRKKMGFPVPLGKWFGGDFLAFAKSVLLDKSCKDHGMFDRAALEKRLSDPSIVDDNAVCQTLWMMLNYDLFYRAHS